MKIWWRRERRKDSRSIEHAAAKNWRAGIVGSGLSEGKRIALRGSVGCFRSSEGFSQVIPHRGGAPA
jgi:hypothetical protein